MTSTQTQDFNSWPRYRRTSVKNDHQIYRVYEIPGKRRSDYYQGSGVTKVFDLSETEREYPPDGNAVPTLQEPRTSAGGNYSIMRKQVESKAVVCPDCEVQAVQDPQKKEVFCPECGFLIGSGDEDAEDPALDRSPESAGPSRYDD